MKSRQEDRYVRCISYWGRGGYVFTPITWWQTANYMPDMTKEGNETASRDRYPFLPAQVEREGREGQLMLLRSKKSIFSF